MNVRRLEPGSWFWGPSHHAASPAEEENYLPDAGEAEGRNFFASCLR